MSRLTPDELVRRRAARGPARQCELIDAVRNVSQHHSLEAAHAALRRCLERGDIEVAYVRRPPGGGKPAPHYRAVTVMDKFLRMRLRGVA